MGNYFNIKENMLKKGYFKLARNVSYHSEHDKFKVGAVIVKRKPISVGFNVIKSHPYYQDNPYIITIHAELRAIISSNRDDLTGSDIYIYRETKDGSPANSRPCDLCMEAIKSAGIKNIFYTVNEKPYWKKEKI